MYLLSSISAESNEYWLKSPNTLITDTMLLYKSIYFFKTFYHGNFQTHTEVGGISTMKSPTPYHPVSTVASILLIFFLSLPLFPIYNFVVEARGVGGNFSIPSFDSKIFWNQIRTFWLWHNHNSIVISNKINNEFLILPNTQFML